VHEITSSTGAGLLFVFKAQQQAHSELCNCCCNTEDGQQDKSVDDVISCTFLSPLLRIYPSILLYKRGLIIQSRYQFSFYDSLIIAAALEVGCTTLYSEDLQHGQQIEQLIVKNPFIE
jgi:predicted nucleic acid-binding protein